MPLTRRSVSRYASCRRRLAGKGASSPRPARNLVAARRLRQCARFRAAPPRGVDGVDTGDRRRRKGPAGLPALSPQREPPAHENNGSPATGATIPASTFPHQYFRTSISAPGIPHQVFRTGRTCRVCRFHPAGCVRCHTLARRPPECCHPGATGAGIPACWYAEPSFFRNFSERPLRPTACDGTNKQ